MIVKDVDNPHQDHNLRVSFIIKLFLRLVAPTS